MHKSGSTILVMVVLLLLITSVISTLTVYIRFQRATTISMVYAWKLQSRMTTMLGVYALYVIKKLEKKHTYTPDDHDSIMQKIRTIFLDDTEGEIICGYQETGTDIRLYAKQAHRAAQVDCIIKRVPEGYIVSEWGYV